MCAYKWHAGRRVVCNVKFWNTETCKCIWSKQSNSVCQQHKQGPKHDTGGKRFYKEPSLKNIDYVTSHTLLYSKGHAFTQGTAKSGGVIKEHPTPFSKYHANLNTNNMYKDNANTNEIKGKKVIKENLALWISG